MRRIFWSQLWMIRLFWIQYVDRGQFCFISNISRVILALLRFYNITLIVFKKSIKIHSYIISQSLLLNLIRKITYKRNLVKLAKTRFAKTFLYLKAMYIQYKNLRILVFSTEWPLSKFAYETLRKEKVNLLIYT